MNGHGAAARSLKIGIVCEGQRGCAETQVFPHLVKLLCPRASLEVVPSGNRPTVLATAPKVAKQLLDDGCAAVFVVWDVYPEWRDHGGTADCKDHRTTLDANMASARLKGRPIVPVAIHEELEAWLLCDADALTAVIGPLVKNKRIHHEDNPDGVSKPKSALCELFKLGRGVRYSPSFSAGQIAARLTTTRRLERSQSFKRFAERIRRLRHCPA